MQPFGFGVGNGIGVGVGFGVGVGVGGTKSLSYAPMSIMPPTMRANPRWSVAAGAF